MNPSSMIPGPKARVCLWAALGCAILLFLVLDLPQADFHVPLYNGGDVLPLLAMAKGIAQGDWIWSNSHLGAPFTAELHDYPVNMYPEAVFMRLLSLFTRSPGVLLNLCWLATVVVTAASAAWALLRLGVRSWIAGPLGVVYALQPYTFYRNEQHLNLSFYFVPLLAAALIELLLGRIKRWREIPVYAWIGIIGQGLSYFYYSFFAAWFLLLAIGAVWFIRRDREAVRAGAVLLGGLVLATLLNLSPNLLYWSQHGRLVAMNFKQPAEAEVYGLKLRHMLTPIPHHALPFMRRISEKLDEARFPNETENISARLGTLQSVGLLVLLAYLLLLPLGKRILSEELIPPAAALWMAGFLLATVGGLGTLFNTFVTADIRCYNRVVVFLAFWCLVAVAVLLERAWRWAEEHEWSGFLLRSCAVVLPLLAVGDQAATYLLTQYDVTKPRYASDEALVRQVEERFPAGARILQLPFTGYPNDNGRERMVPFDQARPYLHSASLRWSWGGVGQRNGSWVESVSNLPTTPMLREACAAAIDGLWVDQYGYPAAGSPVAAIQSQTGQQHLVGPGGRITVFDLRPYCERAYPGLRSAASRSLPPILVTYGEGFWDPEADASHTWHWCRAKGELLLENRSTQARQVQLSMRVQNGATDPAPFIITGPGIQHTEMVQQQQRDLLQAVTVPAHGTVKLQMEARSPRVNAPNDPRQLYFAIYDLLVRE